MTQLEKRALNCLETLLECGPGLCQRLACQLGQEFAQLRTFTAKVERMSLAEDDVLRLERLTNDFLREAGLAGHKGLGPQKRQ
ncbi:MAG: hypothetical protein HDQ44_03495 [Desulfovibrio sp.]|nr:hypothetical protein [Desulfovibrio sp.]